MRLTWNKNIQPDVVSEIEGLILGKWLWLVPGWCQRIHVNVWDSSSSHDTMISINVSYEYRSVCMDFYSGWLNQAPEDRERQTVHELLHIHLGLVADYAESTINRLCPRDEAEKFNGHMQAELTRRNESATQDLAHAIFEKFRGA
jgi:hypothetical protein